MAKCFLQSSVLALLIGLFGCTNSTASALAPQADTARELTIKNEMNRFGVVIDPEIHARLTALFTEVCSQLPADAHSIIVLNDPMPKAATSRNSILISIGLLRLIDNDDQLAFILGHECGHIVENTDDEYIADRFSYFALKKRGFDTTRAVSVFKALPASSFEHAAESHYPALEQRIKQLQSLESKSFGLSE